MNDTVAPDSTQSNPDPRELEMLNRRFSLVDLDYPPIKTIYAYALSHLPREGEGGRRYHGVEPQAEAIPLEPLDPINIVQMEVKLPSLPTIMAELQAATHNPNISSREVGELISRDPSLTAWVLKLVNSPFFGFSVKVDTVSRAVALLGIQQIKTLALGGMLQTLVVQTPEGTVDLDEFWRHSFATALAAQSIWKMIGKDESERLFVAGLLHDCGMLALAFAAPKTYRLFNQKLCSMDKPRYLAEQHLLTFDHARLGGMLLHRWNMPLALIMAVLRHHQVESPEHYPEAAVVHLADVIAFGVSGHSLGDKVPPLDPVVWEMLGLTTGSLNLIMEGMLAKLDDMYKAMRR